MPDLAAPLKLGAHIWPVFSEWSKYLAAMQAADQLGFDSLWAPDHVYPSMGAVDGDMFEAYTALAAVATMTERGGPKVTLGLVARYADANNISGLPAVVAAKDRILVEHCERVGRDEREIERTMRMAVTVVRDSRAEAERVHERIFETAGAEPWPDDPVGTPDDIYERSAALVELGYRHLIFYFPAPYDEETMTRLVTEIRPRLEALTG